MLTDLTVETFLMLRNKFFDEKGNPVSFPLRDKRNTQDDPLDEYISEILKRDLPNNSSCIKAPGPLITPDLVVLRSEICKGSTPQQLRDDLSRIIAVEVKKLERSKRGMIARESGLDYNTTPPCGTVRIYDSANRPLSIRCFYLFICQEPDMNRKGYFKLTALVLCDGNVLNQDFDFYLSIVGERTKQIGLGTYKDGFNRQRPMLVFANPLGAKEMDRHITLIHPDKSLRERYKNLSLSNIMRRSISEGIFNEFYCYRFDKDIPTDWKVSTLVDPFPVPERETKTQPRGKFRLDFRLPE
ncbi:MAG: hypothetical protein COY75_10715 [Nitrospirae bacterium CG_4_10_14_0_8_um_filter_41_23]|nr:MAG: hypothetical protein COV68_00600 [Nitrospirae bacterium CG11_big_fil_rev_8_21_14_0_20_41_14]PIV44629.1 MAG: hypothetical protein COS27_01265 [Nitrospirae bacterium CG02_land_8_20_14_3_00_41_53]PIW86988.1 MAG: hypothetical protein COZ94_07560 [Nitrospirae bacterium CG_4_8_14_3_um_filter_41_47]PIY85920.1 MAG: hypothetical protein COY75_10715 [Nitrospirae bacterium CG_4_10_14_0_8_um_filter_41_23]PJA80875.1 MAG: hypothetical protein CO148_01260 [Nitrospirae bacterium CG_4_9_14_3_um_filter_4